MKIFFVGNANGKVKEHFFKITEPIFIKNNISMERFFSIDEFLKKYKYENNELKIIINIYHEDTLNYNDFTIMEKKLYKNDILIHPTKLGIIVGSKKNTNIFLSEKNILCPKIIDKTDKNLVVFENENNTSGANVRLLYENDVLNHKKYNTEFIDTLYKHNNELYYSSIRTLCVGNEIVAVFLRFRNVKENNPSVHCKDTPLISSLINSYYEEVIIPNIGNLTKICENIGNVLGLGFYAHDFAYSFKDNDFFLLETGFKLHDSTHSNKVKSISKKLNFITDDTKICESVANTFIKKIKKMVK